MDLQQEQIARTLGEGHRVIHGAAGSGKTMILVFRAAYLAAAAQPGRPILVLCFNRTLADRLEAVLRARGVDERVQVRTFHGWCQDLVRSYQLGSPALAALRGDAYFEALATTVERAVDQGRVPQGQYTALLIDEAHDFADAWLRLAGRMVDPATRSLLVLYDDAQSIYQGRRRHFNFASVGIEARGRTSILRLNYRNTAEVLALAVHCAQTLLTGDGADPSATADDDNTMPLVQPASAGRRGPLPVLLKSRDALEEARLITERIASAQAEGRALSDIAVLCRTKALMRPIEAQLRRHRIAHQSMAAEAFRRFDWQRDSVKLITLHSAKGLEFGLVFVAGLQAMPLAEEKMADAVRLLYVAMTRSTQQLVLSAHAAGEGGAGPAALVQQVEQALVQVAQALTG
jgi:superfamily I DNA/RNA helicase